MEWALLIIVAVAWLIGTPIVAIVALIRARDAVARSERLAAEVADLRQRLTQQGEIETDTARVAPAEPTPVVESTPEVAPEPAPPIVQAPSLPPVFTPEPPPFIPVPVAAGWEQRLGARAFIWVGAITLALSAVFLVRYSIEEGYLSPEVRVILAALFGFALIGGAERLKARDERVAQAMAGAGVVALYGALLSAAALYAMISKVAAGGGAAALTAFAIGVSLRHGIFVAGLAFIGGFASPAIIGSEDPNTPVLFGYLLAIAAGTLWVIRLRGWWPLGWGVLAGAALWVGVWLVADVDGLPFVAAFLVATAALFVWATWRRLAENDNPSSAVAILIWSALAVTGLLLVALVAEDDGWQSAGWLGLALHGAGLYALGRWTPRFQHVATLAPALSLAALGVWWFLTAGIGGGWDADRFAWRAILFGGFYAGGAFALLWNAGRPGFWAALSVAAALAHFLFAWWVLRFQATGTPWGLISLGLAAPFLVGAERLVRWRGQMAGATEALGFLAAGVSFFIAAAIPLELDRHWITVAYALELAAVAYIAAWLDLPTLRRICWGLLAVVVARFVLNPYLFDYPIGVTPVFNWILGAYSVSIAALVVSLHYLRGTPDLRLVQAIEASVALLIFTLLTLEVHSLFQWSSTDVLKTSFAERACHVAAWGAFAVAALWMVRLRLDPVPLWAWRLSGSLAAGVVLIVQVLAANPIFAPTSVGDLPILNMLLLAYAVPAALAALARRWIDVENSSTARLLTGGLASVLAFVYVSLEVRHFFDPAFKRELLDAAGLELYAYSIVWLLFGVGLLALGFWRGAAALRHAGMALVCIVVAKVFLIDMEGLKGLLRVVSFLGLGAALLGLGYAYRRFGFDQRQQS